MYTTGDFIESGDRFDAENCGERTTRYMDLIDNDLTERHWNSIFGTLSAFSKQTKKEEAMQNSQPEDQHARVPLPPSDPPSPVRDE
jgi:hypothetical protein